MPTTLHSRPCLERMALIRRKLISGAAFKPEFVAVELEVSRKTIDRDIQFMRDRLGYRIEYDPETKAWTGRPPAQPVL